MASIRGTKPSDLRWDVSILVPEGLSIINHFQLNIKQKLNTRLGNFLAAEAEKDSIIENLPTFNFEGTAYWVDPVMG